MIYKKIYAIWWIMHNNIIMYTSFCLQRYIICIFFMHFDLHLNVSIVNEVAYIVENIIICLHAHNIFCTFQWTVYFVGLFVCFFFIVSPRQYNNIRTCRSFYECFWYVSYYVVPQLSSKKINFKETSYTPEDETWKRTFRAIWTIWYI